MVLVKCSECGRDVSDKEIFFPGCGIPNGGALKLQKPIIVIVPKSRSLAAVMALFLGAFGIHKFYLNSPGWGLIYLAFSWTFIPVISGVIDAINLIIMSDKEFQEIYAK